MRERIESVTNKKIKLAASLKERKNRRKTGLFIAEGIRLSEMVLNSGWQVEFALYTPEMAREARGEKLLGALEDICSLYEVTADVYKKVSATETPQGILLVIQQQKKALADLPIAKVPLYVVMDGVQDPGNAGTIVRIADAAGADGVVLLKGTTDIYADKVVRSTMGSIFNLPTVAEISSEELIKFAREKHCQLLATALDETAQAIYECDLTEPTVLVFGNEGNGVSQEILQAAAKVYIPMYGKAESLNVGASAAIAVYEAIRQRNYSK